MSADDVVVTVDHLAGMRTGRPVVTIRFDVDRDLFDAPVDEWADIAVREAVTRHVEARTRPREMAP